MKKKKGESSEKSESFPSTYYRDSRESILEIVKDDVLRILGEEESRKVPSKAIKSRIKASSSIISDAIEKLRKNGLIRLENGSLELTESGCVQAERIIKKHSVFEDYFKKKRGREEAHKVADIIEHYVSEEVLNNIKKLSTFERGDFSILESGLNEDRLITDIEISDSGLFERVVSMGIIPGEKIRVMYNIPDGFVVSVSRKKVALGSDIAEKIRVMK